MGILTNISKRREKERSDLIKDAINDAQHIALILGKRFSAEEVILYGSLANKRHFDMASDIDIAVKGLGDKYFMAYGYCLRQSKFNLDIRLYEDMPAKFKNRVDAKGIILYAKKRKR